MAGENQPAAPVFGYRHVWLFFLAVIVVFTLLGARYWEELRVTTPAPGFANGIAFLSQVAAFSLLVTYLIIIARRKAKGARGALSVWFGAQALAILALALYAVPGFPGWAFFLMIAAAVAVLILTRPYRPAPR
jgi:peptidoglycan/LPS O-acetylase OafA/YrhL